MSAKKEREECFALSPHVRIYSAFVVIVAPFPSRVKRRARALRRGRLPPSRPAAVPSPHFAVEGGSRIMAFGKKRKPSPSAAVSKICLASSDSEAPPPSD